MHTTFTNWLLFFYIYSFFGWIWESAYASVGQKRFVNRGFLHGPMIPIYGFGALGVLFSTMDAHGSIPLVFLFGMIGATALEYVTGWGMEKLFHVKYWDYSMFPFNLHGYICLYASLGWGLFSVLLVRVIHPPIAELIAALGRTPAEIVAFLLTSAAAADTLQSVNEAFDLRDMLQKLEESRTEIGKLQRRLEITSVMKLDEYKQRLRSAEQKIGRHAGAFEMPAAFRRRFAENLQLARSLRREQLMELLNKTETLTSGLGAGNTALSELLKNGISRSDLLKLRENILGELQKLGARGDRSYRNAARILRRNPRAISEKYRGALRELRDMLDND